MASSGELIRSKKITRSAQGQPCFLQLPCICNHNPETTVWAHLNGAAFGKGAGIKAHDIAGFPACYDCHFAYDQHKTGLSEAELNAALLKAVVNAWVMLIDRGIVIVPVDPVEPMMDRPIKERKPKAVRKPTPKPSKQVWSKRAWPSKKPVD